MFRQRFLSFAGQHQHGFAARPGHGLQIAQAVAHHIGVFGFGVETVENVQHHAAFRLAAAAVGGGGVRAEPNAVYHAARLLNHLVHFVVHFGQFLHGEQAAPDAGLVSGHGHSVASLGEEGDGIHAAGQGNPFVGRLYKVVPVLVDDAVAVENYQFHIGVPKRLRHCRA